MREPHNDLGDILTARERVLMVAWMLPNQGDLTDSQRRQAMDNFSAYIRRHNMTPTDVARQIGKPKATTIGELMKGVYRANADDHIRTLNMFIEQHARAKAASLTDTFISTKVAKDILAVARLARENQTLALVMGPTGIGKSRCGLAVAEKYVGSIYIRVIRGYQHPNGFTSALAEKLGVRKHARSDHRVIHHSQLERVIDALRNSGRLIIIDEAHKLWDTSVDLLRDIHDTTGVPMLLLATRDLHDRILKDADPDHGQLYSRFGVMHHLSEANDVYGGQGKALYSVADIKALYDEPPVRLSKDATEYLHGVANNLGYGSLRRCKELVQSGARRARKRQGLEDGDKVTVTAADLEFAETRMRSTQSDRQAVADRRRQAASLHAG